MERIEIGLTQFIDFTLKQGVSRVNFVKQVKYQSDYQPSFDYWKRLREEINSNIRLALEADAGNFIYIWNKV